LLLSSVWSLVGLIEPLQTAEFMLRIDKISHRISDARHTVPLTHRDDCCDGSRTVLVRLAAPLCSLDDDRSHANVGDWIIPHREGALPSLSRGQFWTIAPACLALAGIRAA